jgi:hypothetical protein
MRYICFLGEEPFTAKDPDYVTAAALEKTPQGISVWLAANVNIEPKAFCTALGASNASLHPVNHG